MNPIYYTLAITLCNEEICRFKNLTTEQVQEIQTKIWSQGIRKKINHTTYELISPLLIRKALLIEQEAFYTSE